MLVLCCRREQPHDQEEGVLGVLNQGTCCESESKDCKGLGGVFRIQLPIMTMGVHRMVRGRFESSQIEDGLQLAIKFV